MYDRWGVGAGGVAPPVHEGLVFVIDDDESVRRALGRLLRSVGLRVETFASAQAFLGRDLSRHPACAVVDLRLPGPSGLELQDALKGCGRDLPIIFVTGHGDVPSSVRAMKAGAIDFIEKPFSDQTLLDTVQGALMRDQHAGRERVEREGIERRLGGLTRREREVLGLVVQGLLNKQIAGELGVSEKTVKVHRARVMEKMRVGSLAELVRIVEHVTV